MSLKSVPVTDLANRFQDASERPGSTMENLTSLVIREEEEEKGKNV